MSNKSVELIISDFVARQRQLLELELRSEEAEERRASTSSTIRDAASSASIGASSSTALVLRDLQVSEVSVGLYGRTVVTLTATIKKTNSSIDSNLTTSMTLPEASQEPLLPAHRFTVGDEVEVRSSSTSPKDTSSGVIKAVTDTAISLALFSNRKQQCKNKKDDKKDANGQDDDENILGPPPLMIVPKSAMEVHRKLVQALDQLQQHGIYHPLAGKVVEACFTCATTRTATTSGQQSLTNVINTTLDDSQQEAIRFCLQSSDRPVTLCHGPPGTGKTTTMAELIRQAVQVHHMKVLVTAPSNVAVDNILERLIQTMSLNPSSNSKRKTPASSVSTKCMRMVRLGHPARIKPSILPYSLESLVYHSEGTEIVADVRKELQYFLQKLTTNKKTTSGVDRKVAYQEVKRLRKEVQERETKVIQELLSRAQIILATTVGAANSILKRYVPDGFDLVIIDEAAQALEASCWIPALQGKRLVLAGDHCQLPPTIQNVKVQVELGKTLFERIMELYKEEGNDKEANIHRGVGRVSRMLQVQYRMHKSIADWASKAMYGGKLQTHESVQNRTLSDLIVTKSRLREQQSATGDDENGDKDISKMALLWIDTAGCGLYESTNAAGSRYNDGEAQIVVQHVQTLLRIGIKSTDIAIITPYNGQVEFLKSLLLSSPLIGTGNTSMTPLEIRSVDGFQGGEREAVVISLVRSSESTVGGGGSAGIGFLRDDRRLNVAVTRAKRHCAVIGDSETVSQSKLIQSLFHWIEDHGEQRSAMEYLQPQRHYNDVLQSELRDAAKMLRKITMSESSKITTQEATSLKAAKKSPSRTSDEDTRTVLLEKISTFAKKKTHGEAMILSTELSPYDRMIVHEFAGKLGLGHASQGQEGVDRRIVLTIPEANVTPNTSHVVGDAARSEKDEDNESPGNLSDMSFSNVKEPMSARAFTALNFGDASDDDDDEDESKSEGEDNQNGQDDDIKIPTLSTTMPAINTTLANLARERALRERKKAAEKTAWATSETTKKLPKLKGQKLGGNIRTTQQSLQLSDNDALEDDIAFLNAQMNYVQTSHGRKVEGTGSNYRTVVNGILVSKPPPQVEMKRNKRASASLQAKLKSAQEERKAKGAKKKK